MNVFWFAVRFPAESKTVPESCRLRSSPGSFVLQVGPTCLLRGLSEERFFFCRLSSSATGPERRTLFLWMAFRSHRCPRPVSFRPKDSFRLFCNFSCFRIEAVPLLRRSLSCKFEKSQTADLGAKRFCIRLEKRSCGQPDKHHRKKVINFEPKFDFLHV